MRNSVEDKLSDSGRDYSQLLGIAPPPSLLNVLVVDDEVAIRQLIKLRLESKGLRCRAAANVRDAQEQLICSHFDVVLSDLNMPGGSGLDLAEWMSDKYPEIPMVLVTGVNEVRLATHALKSGVSDYIVKPFEIDELLTSLNSAVRERHMQRSAQLRHTQLEQVTAEQTEQLSRVMQELHSTYEATLEALGMALESRDHETLGHSRRVANLSRAIAQRLGITGQELDMITFGSYLHDIGKIGIADAILRKPGPLNAQEKENMREHVELGYRIVSSIPFLRPASNIVRCHHESFDGTGYPRGLCGPEIPLGARVFVVADTVDAITSDRPYRKAQPLTAAKNEILRCTGTQFDPAVTQAFLQIPDSELERILSLGSVKPSEPACGAHYG